MCYRHIKQVFIDAVSLYDHDQSNIYNMAVNALHRRVRKGVRSYKSSRQRIQPDLPPKKEYLITVQAITEVSTKTCCENNCSQPFPRSQILAIHTELYVKDGVYSRKKCLLGVHGQIHKDPFGKKWITLKETDVCPQHGGPFTEFQRLPFIGTRIWPKWGRNQKNMGIWDPKSLKCTLCKLLQH